MTTTTPATAPYVWVRHETAAKALAAASRLTSKYGIGFAVVQDDMGIAGFTHPCAVISHPAAR
jgi:hypothetical protein